MINNLVNYFKDKKILILGFGREGRSTYNVIRKYLKNQKIYIADKDDVRQKHDFLNQDDNIEIIFGDNYLENLDEYDIIMKAPGISFAGMDISKFENKITSQLELFLELFNVNSIGITGTKGKSTTSTLIYTILKEQNKECMLLGNIGNPVFEYIDEIKENMYIVLEMSSHQLEYMKKSPHISVLLNVYEEHLDHYESYEKYALAKCNIYRNQTENDILLYSADNEMLRKLVKNVKGKEYKVSLIEDTDICLKNDEVFFEGEKIYDKNEKRNLLGDYNLNNIMFALGVSKLLNLNMDSAIQSVANFKTLSHRLEFVKKVDGVSYYDNSIGTVPMATIEAVKALENVNSLIIGGMDRGLDYTDFIKYLEESKIENIICMPKTGHDIAQKITKKKCYVVDTLEEAVSTAKKVTQKDTICLLSPTAASYGFFKNFEEKGDLFKKFVCE